VDRLARADAVDVGAELAPGRDVPLEHGVQERPIDPRLHQRQQRPDRVANVPAQPEVELRRRPSRSARMSIWAIFGAVGMKLS